MLRKFIVALLGLPGYNKTLIMLNRKEAEMTAVHVTDKNFEAEVLKSNLPVLVDFLGRMVRPMPDDQPYCGRDRERPPG